MLTSSLVSDSTIDTFVVVYKFAFDFSLFHHKVTVICYSYSDHSNNWVSISIFGIRISIHYFCLNFSIKINTDESVFLEAL